MNETDMAGTSVPMSAHTIGPRFGIATAPSQVSYSVYTYQQVGLDPG